MVLAVGLTLAETLVKNCHDPVHREISSERFMAAVAKIARVRRDGQYNIQSNILQHGPLLRRGGWG